MKSKMLFAILVFASAIACGGEVKESEEDTTTDAKKETSSTDSSSDEQTTGWDFGARQPGECVEGFDPLEEPERPCNWLGDDGLCYDDWEVACSCVCSLGRDCIVESYEGKGEVYCS